MMTATVVEPARPARRKTSDLRPRRPLPEPATAYHALLRRPGLLDEVDQRHRLAGGRRVVPPRAELVLAQPVEQLGLAARAEGQPQRLAARVADPVGDRDQVLQARADLLVEADLAGLRLEVVEHAVGVQRERAIGRRGEPGEVAQRLDVL